MNCGGRLRALKTFNKNQQINQQKINEILQHTHVERPGHQDTVTLRKRKGWFISKNGVVIPLYEPDEQLDSRTVHKEVSSEHFTRKDTLNIGEIQIIANIPDHNA